MLPDLRVAVAAVLSGLVLIVTAFGLAATVRIAHHAKVGPIELPRTLAYAEPDDWDLGSNRTRALPIDTTDHNSMSTDAAEVPAHQAVDTPPTTVVIVGTIDTPVALEPRTPPTTPAPVQNSNADIE